MTLATTIAADREAQEQGVMPEYIDPSSMCHILMSMDVQKNTAGWLDRFQDRSGFDEVVSEGLAKAVSHALEAKPSEYGAKLTDGQWNENIIRAFVTLGEWLRERAPDSLRERLQGYDTGDDILTRAIGFKDDTPVISR
jgi:hypothetical protein